MSSAIHLTVATVVERDNRYLLVKESINGHPVINQPAGHVEPHEKLQDAAVRETREETGFDVELTGLIGLSTYYAESSDTTFHRVTFLARLIGANPVHPVDPEIEGIVWMSLEQVQNCENLRSPMVAHDIQLAANGTCHPLSTVWEQGPQRFVSESLTSK